MSGPAPKGAAAPAAVSSSMLDYLERVGVTLTREEREMRALRAAENAAAAHGQQPTLRQQLAVLELYVDSAMRHGVGA